MGVRAGGGRLPEAGVWPAGVTRSGFSQPALPPFTPGAPASKARMSTCCPIKAKTVQTRPNVLRVELSSSSVGGEREGICV